MELLLGCVVVLVGTILLNIYDRNYTKKLWNDGVCKDCGTEWKYTDTASTGDDVYQCGCGKHFCRRI